MIKKICYLLYLCVILSCNKNDCDELSENLIYKTFEFTLLSNEYSEYFMDRIFIEENDLLSKKPIEISFKIKNHQINYIENKTKTLNDATIVKFTKYSLYDNEQISVEFIAQPCNMKFDFTFAKNDKGEFICIEHASEPM